MNFSKKKQEWTNASDTSEQERSTNQSNANLHDQTAQRNRNAKTIWNRMVEDMEPQDNQEHTESSHY